MIRYVPTSNAMVCEALTEALWGLARPPALRSAKDTQKMFRSITCTNGSVWLQVDTEFDISVHPDAELNRLADILQPWINSGELPADTNDVLSAFIESKRGVRMIPWEAFPTLFKTLSKTREQLVSLGLLNDPTTH